MLVVLVLNHRLPLSHANIWWFLFDIMFNIEFSLSFPENFHFIWPEANFTGLCSMYLNDQFIKQ